MKKKTAVIVISLISVTAVVLGGLAWSQAARARQLETALMVSHDHAFAELVNGMSELDTALQKSLYATSPSVISAVCTDVFGKAMTAQMSLGSLPFSTQELEKTAGFISRVGDYAYTLSRSGRAYTDEERENLRALSETASLLAGNFQELQRRMDGGEMTMDELFAAVEELEQEEEADVPDTLSVGMRITEEEFPEVPSLIYDGPFSEHIRDAEPQLLAGQPLVSEAEARKAAAEFLAMEESELYSLGKSESVIPCYYFMAGELTVEVTEQGGRVMNFLSAYAPDSALLTAGDAVSIARTFLAERGYDNMSESYYMTRSNVCTINFAYDDGGVLCYPDLVKVSVALDGGMVVGFEAAGYISSHTERDLPEPAVDRETARAQVAPDLAVGSSRLCVIPTSGKYEELCWEFVCTASDGEKYIIYVDAETGEQAKILILLEDENGSLTI